MKYPPEELAKRLTALVDTIRTLIQFDSKLKLYSLIRRFGLDYAGTQKQLIEGNILKQGETNQDWVWLAGDTSTADIVHLMTQIREAKKLPASELAEHFQQLEENHKMFLESMAQLEARVQNLTQRIVEVETVLHHIHPKDRPPTPNELKALAHNGRRPVLALVGVFPRDQAHIQSKVDMSKVELLFIDRKGPPKIPAKTDILVIQKAMFQVPGTREVYESFNGHKYEASDGNKQTCDLINGIGAAWPNPSLQ